MPDLGYLRFPTIHENLVAFACDDDLWLAPAEGGRAWRLTSGVGEAVRPRFSADGQSIAFVGREEGPTEIYTVPVEGGAPTRLTYQGANCLTAGWSPAGEIVYASNADRPLARELWLWAIEPAGGLPRQFQIGPAITVGYGANGGLVIGRNTLEPARWKRYRGGTAGDLWIDRTGSGSFERLIAIDGNLTTPCWVGDRIYFISDHEGSGNVYSCTPEGQDLRRHSDHGDFYARNLSSDGRQLVYHSGGSLYRLNPSARESERITITIGSSRSQRSRRFVPAGRFLDTVSLSADGSGLALTSRGKAFTFANWEGAVHQHGEPDGIRYRLLSWLNDKKRLIAAASGEEDSEYLVLLTADGTAEPNRLEADLGRIDELSVAPVGDLVAVTNHRNELFVVDLTTASSRRLDQSPNRPIDGIAWSPDAAWIAYGYGISRQRTAIKLCRVESGETTVVSNPVLHDSGPSFDPAGDFLYFLGQRDFDPVYDSLQFELSFPKGRRPFLIALRKDVQSPFLPRPKAPESPEAEAAEKAEAEREPATPKPITIDLDGIERRVLGFPVPEGRYGRIAGVAGKALFSVYPVEGSRHHSWADLAPAANGALEAYDFEHQKLDRMVEGMSDFWLGRDAKTLLYRAGDRIRVLKAGEKAPEPKPGDDPSKASRTSGWIDLSRVRVSVRPAAEWRQMFREAWRLQREHFWTEDMSGIDWNAIYDRYLPLVDRVSSRGELSDLLWEMQGELGTSHAYEIGGDYRPGPNYHQGYLGVDWRRTDRGYEIARIVQGDPWDPDATSPLNSPGVDLATGDRILAVNGQPVGAAGPAELLVNQAGSEVMLTVQRSDEAPRMVTVKAIGSEFPARYRDWVDGNRAKVKAATDGRIGYVHIPDMGPDGFAEFHRSYLAEYDHDALIVDVRFNGGGHVSQLLLEKLARKRLGYDFARWFPPEPYPNESPRGVLVAITNEQAGSDGDMFSHVFKMLKLGPLIGKRTWGGVIGISPRHRLADGTVTTQPEYAFFFDDVGWGIENYGTDPDIEVENRPQDYLAGDDPQLDRAISVALELLAERSPHTPTPTNRPSRIAPSLPGRASGSR